MKEEGSLYLIHKSFEFFKALRKKL